MVKKTTEASPPVERSGLSRRAAISAGAGVAAAAAIATSLGSAAPASADGNSYTSADLLGNDQLLHLLRRASYGLTPKLIREATLIGGAAWLEQQLSPTTIPDPNTDLIMAQYPKFLLDAQTSHDLINPGGQAPALLAVPKPRIPSPTIARISEAVVPVPPITGFQVAIDTVIVTSARAVWGERHLQEVMANFWLNHFNVWAADDSVYWMRHIWDRIIRDAAMGKFSDLLKVAIKYPSLTMYFSAAFSTKDHPNENLGRELLELHTLGIGNYAEQDVKQSALMLTGLSATTAGFKWNPWYHYVGPITVDTFYSANASATDGLTAVDAYLDYLAHHPATATHLATKLATRFISENPPKSIIDTLAAAYLAHDTDIPSVLRVLFTSREFAASIGQKGRTPFEDVVATVRTLGHINVPKTDYYASLDILSTVVGQRPMMWEPPNGYPIVIYPWLSPVSLLQRLDVHYAVANKETMAAGMPDWHAWYPFPLPATWGAAIDAVALRIVSAPLKPRHRDAILSSLGVAATTTVTAAQLAIATAGTIIPALLDSPYHWSK